MQHAFEYIVEYSDWLEHADSSAEPQQTEDCTIHSSCRIPALGQDILVDFYLENLQLQQPCFKLQVTGASLSDFGWICTKIYEKRDIFRGGVSTDHLREQVVDHLNREPPSSGFVPSSSADSEEERRSQQEYLRSVVDAAQLRQLEDIGYIVLDLNNNESSSSTTTRHQSNSYHITPQIHNDISQYFVETTGDEFRKDLVHFLTRSQAEEVGLEEHYKILLSIATYLNHNLKFRESEYTPIAPATTSEPLTTPRMIQLAQYSHGGFYEAHSDNSLYESKDENGKRLYTKTGNRNNFRHYTCILYCNDLVESDGGALRLYLNSRDLCNEDAMEECNYVDIIPKNGRLLIFDSCMVHTVEELLSATKIRRALTLWILRPNNSDVAGESYY